MAKKSDLKALGMEAEPEAPTTGGGGDVELIADSQPVVVSRYSGQIVTDEAEVNRIVEYLEGQYAIEESVREQKKPRWEKWRKQLDADPEDKPAATKLENPSRIRPPLAQINGQTMAAKLNSHFAMRDP